MIEQKTEFFFSFIEGANGAYIKTVVDEDSESKLTKVLFKPSAANMLELLKSLFSFKPKKYRHEMPERYVRHIRMPVADPKIQGTFNNYVFIIPSRDMPNVLYEKTLYFKLFGGVASREMDLEKKVMSLQIDLEDIEIRFTEYKRNHGQKKQATQTTVKCPKCSKEMTADQLRASGGWCTTPGCVTKLGTPTNT